MSYFIVSTIIRLFYITVISLVLFRLSFRFFGFVRSYTVVSSLFGCAGMIFSIRSHPQLALFLHKDDFFRPDSSPACFFLPQGLFLSAGFIPSLLFFSTRMISIGQIHPQLALLFRRDYFDRPDSSPACSFLPQGLSLPLVCIPSLLFFSTRMISTKQMHPCNPSLRKRAPPGAPKNPGSKNASGIKITI